MQTIGPLDFRPESRSLPSEVRPDKIEHKSLIGSSFSKEPPPKLNNPNSKENLVGLFNNLMSKIFGHAAPAAASTSGAQASAAPASGATAPAPAPAAPVPVVDVAVILNGLAAKNPEKLDWKRSIVDLMKLVGMDSSLGARKQLATELHYTGDQNDSASMNIWLHKEVLRKLSENGGKVPPELLT